MTDPRIGLRVGVLLSAKPGKARLLGYGVYEGVYIPDPASPDAPIMAGILAETGTPTPRIKLDGGDTVWGCECWWGPEPLVRAALEKPGVEVEVVSIRDHRKRGRATR